MLGVVRVGQGNVGPRSTQRLEDSNRRINLCTADIDEFRVFAVMTTSRFLIHRIEESFLTSLARTHRADGNIIFELPPRDNELCGNIKQSLPLVTVT